MLISADWFLRMRYTRRMLTEGNYWFWGNESVKLYDITKAFNAPFELNILLQDETLAEALIVLDVKDSEIALQYKNGLLEAVLGAGRYAFWQSAVEYKFIKADTGKIEITEPIERSVLLHRLVAPSYVAQAWKAMNKLCCLLMENLCRCCRVVYTTGGRMLLRYM